MAKSAAPKSSAPAPVVDAPAPAPSSGGSATIAAKPAAEVAKNDTLVLEWDPQEMGKEAGWEGEGGVDAATGKKIEKQGDAEVTDADDAVTTDGADDVEAAAEDDEPEAPKPDKARAERRAAVLRTLNRERSQRGAEEQARAARADLERTQAELAKLKERIEGQRKGSLAERLAAAGVTKEELEDALVMGAVDKDKLPPKGEAPSKEVEELRAELAALKTALADKDKKAEESAAASRVEQARQHVRELIKDADVPLVKDLGAEDRVLKAAWDTWSALGKKGTVSEFIPAAAEVIEQRLEKEKPNLAALKKRPPAAEGDAAPAKKKPAPAVGRRTAPARPARETRPLSSDLSERIRQVSNEMGWS